MFIIIPGTTTAEFFGLKTWTLRIASPFLATILCGMLLFDGADREFRLCVESDLYVGMIEVVEADHKRVRETH